MSEESARLAKAVADYCAAEGIPDHRAEAELAYRMELARTTTRTFLRDPDRMLSPNTARAFEKLLGWAPGTITARVPATRPEAPGEPA
jgi:hypothetical protein